MGRQCCDRHERDVPRRRLVRSAGRRMGRQRCDRHERDVPRRRLVRSAGRRMGRQRRHRHVRHVPRCRRLQFLGGVGRPDVSRHHGRHVRRGRPLRPGSVRHGDTTCTGRRRRHVRGSSGIRCRRVEPGSVGSHEPPGDVRGCDILQPPECVATRGLDCDRFQQHVRRRHRDGTGRDRMGHLECHTADRHVRGCDCLQPGSFRLGLRRCDQVRGVPA